MKKKINLPVNSTILKIFASIVLISAFTATILFLISFLGLSTILMNSGDIFPNNPRDILARISEHFSVTADENGNPISFTLTDEGILPENYWCILLDENGDTIWSMHKPADIPDHYSINDIARFTRWFLEDYPVYVRTEDYGLFILGIPKNSVGKYSMEFTMDWFDSLASRIVLVFILNFTIAMLLSVFLGSSLYSKIKLLTKGLTNLRKEEIVSLPVKGIFREPFSDINQTSRVLARKNAQLAVRDQARANWISGISHDIRTPLSMVVGYGGQLAEDTELSEETRRYAAIITAQGLKIKKLIEDLNLISSLEYDMQPTNKKALQISVLLRSVVGEILNSDLSNEAFDISLALQCGQATILGDESLLSRAFYNLLQNSITHNENGCRITVSGSLQAEYVCIVIADDGQGVPQKVLDNLDILPNTAHGLGLPMAYKIVRAHGGTFHAENRGGFVVTIQFPLFKA